MKVYSGLKNFSAENPVVTIGMFDGLHAGHRVLLQKVIEKAREINGESVIISFWPHPRIVLNKDADNLRFLTSLEEKTKLFSETGIDHLVLIPFTKDFASLTAGEFIEKILIKGIKLKHLVVGYDHRFGRDMASSQTEFYKYAEKHRFTISKVDEVAIDGQHISSSVIRDLILKGKIKKANRLLTYNYLLSGRVIGGQQLGRTIGYPTANIQPQEPRKLIPPDGVYACIVHILGEKHGGMLNIGYRPTLKTGQKQRSVEVHILDFERDIYSEETTIEFIERIRDEKKFTGLKQLKARLSIDEKIVRKVLKDML
jgi:riboflavin kinase/FMN adenylyltransferase